MILKHTLGRSGRTGGVDHAGDVVRRRRRHDFRRGAVAATEAIQIDDRKPGRKQVTGGREQLRRREDYGGSRMSGDACVAFRWMVGVQWHTSASRRQYTEDGRGISSLMAQH